MNHELFVKICGITRLEDAISATTLGADAVGFIFYPESKRHVSYEHAKPIAENVRSAGVSRVGVFVNPTLLELENAVRSVSLDFIQLHGDESATFVDSVKKMFPHHQIIKAIRLGTCETTLDFASDYELLDHQSKNWGGTGEKISWDEAKLYVQSKPKPVLLAGGINAENILAAVESVKPSGVDLSSGVESAPGIKSKEKLKALFEKLGRGQS